MKFFNYNIIPEDQYMYIIKESINTLRKSPNYELIFKFLKDVNTTSSQEKIYTEQIYPLLDSKNSLSFKTLYCLKTGRLEDVCEDYEIDQGHLSNDQTNEIVLNICDHQIDYALAGKSYDQ